jgi:predicted DNA-binding transcriptional regulator AlpA
MQFNQEYLSKRQLKNLLGISYSTIHRKFKNFPRLKLGEAKNSRVLFPRPQIDEFITREFMDSNSAKPKS